MMGMRTVLSKIRLLATVLVILVPQVKELCAETQPAAPCATPQMMELIHAHRSVLERINTPDNQAKPPQLGNAQMAPLLTKGWKLAGEWAAGWLDCHPNPSARDLETLFVNFTPPPHAEVYESKQP